MNICRKYGKELKTRSALISHEKFCKQLYCKVCNKLLQKSQKVFCSTSCSAIFNNKGKKHSEETKRKISISQGGNGNIKEKEKFCLFCKKQLIKSQLKYCNKTCKNNKIRQDKINKWLNGEIEGTSLSGHQSFIKYYLIEKYENKCSRCGWGEMNPYTKSIPLEVEHIDGNSYNNKPNNVILLCPNCHSLTKTYRGANRGNGRRQYLKKYYLK